MGVNKFNAEGYFDPTAYEAIKNINQEIKAETFRPLMFICSPFTGDIDRNIRKAEGYCRFAITKKCIPLSPHLLFSQLLDDDDKEQRELSIFMGMVLMSKCKEVWVFGRNISKGMARVIQKANQRNIPIRYFNDKCEEVELK